MRAASNIVSNAIKYTQHGRVVIALRRTGSIYRVEVHDTGPGLSGADFQEALIRNQRLERDLGVAEGSGLGLALVKAIAEENGWTISSCADRRTGASIRLVLVRRAVQPSLRLGAAESSAVEPLGDHIGAAPG
jgi:two-component system, sensor histidine kinase LadS